MWHANTNKNEARITIYLRQGTLQNNEDYQEQKRTKHNDKEVNSSRTYNNAKYV